MLSTLLHWSSSANMASNFVVATFTALGQSSCCLDVASDACTTSRYSTKFSLGQTGALVATAPDIKWGYLILSQADRAPEYDPPNEIQRFFSVRLYLSTMKPQKLAISANACSLLK